MLLRGFLSLLFCLLSMPGVWAADDLKLKEGLSFDQDLDSGFPIVASNMDDAKLPVGQPALLFFGASGDLNTNRQARRLVDVYRRYRDANLKFVVIDVDNPAGVEAKQLVKTYYRSYIPFEVLLDKTGQVVWSQVGEVESKLLEGQIAKVLPQ